MKYVRFGLGLLALLLFFLVIDSSGVGLRQHIQRIKGWAARSA